MTEQNKNLVLRVATALVLLPAVLFLLWKGGLWFTMLVSIAGAAAAFELNQLPALGAIARAAAAAAAPPPDDEAGKKGKKAKAAAHPAAAGPVPETVITGATLVSAGAAFLLPLLQHAPLGMLTSETVIAGTLLLAFLDALFFEDDLSKAPVRVGFAVLGALYAGLAMAALVRLRALDHGTWWILLTLAVTWLNDTGAYFAGRAFGKRKLYPRISPSKTWEGAVGGLFASVGGAMGVQALFLPALPLWAAAAIGAVAGVVGPLGDLSESMLKRAFGAKDSGKLLPGHGGMLDRIDALLFTAPMVWFCAQLLGMN